MSGKTSVRLRSALFLLLVVMVSAIPIFAASAVVGSVAGSANATVGGQALAPNTTLFSGDSLRVTNGAAVVAMGLGSRMVFGRDTMASFERGSDEVTALLGQGNVSIYHPEDGTALRVKVGEISISAGKGFKTLGEVAMVNGAVVVAAKEGMLRVEAPQRSLELTKGKSIVITQKPAGLPQPQGTTSSGTPVTHPSSAEIISIVSLGGIGANVVMSVINLKRTNDVKTLVNQVNTTASKADQDAIAAINAANSATAAATAARAAANAAGLAASEACKLVSPTDPNCAFSQI